MGSDVVECRTLPRLTQAIFVGLINLVGAVGIVLALLSGGQVPLIVAGVVFMLCAVVEWRSGVGVLASHLRFSRSTGVLHWRAPAGGGSIPLTEVTVIRPRASRPGAFVLCCRDGSGVPFWLLSRGPSVARFFQVLAEENPSLSVDAVPSSRNDWLGAIFPRTLPPPEPPAA